MSEASEMRGTMECPYCNRDNPHHHRPDEIKGMVAGLLPRLTRLVDELGSPGCGFYSAMHRAYGTDYSYLAEKAFCRDLRHVLAKLTGKGTSHG